MLCRRAKSDMRAIPRTAGSVHLGFRSRLALCLAHGVYEESQCQGWQSNARERCWERKDEVGSVAVFVLSGNDQNHHVLCTHHHHRRVAAPTGRC